MQYELASEARNATTSATSSASPIRGIGKPANTAALSTSSNWSPPVIGVSITPGWTELTRIPAGPSSMAAVLVMPRIAHFEAT